jgi:hypothetical protein
MVESAAAVPGCAWPVDAGRRDQTGTVARPRTPSRRGDPAPGRVQTGAGVVDSLVQPRARRLRPSAGAADAAGMEITDIASTSLLGKSLDGVRTVLAQAQSAPSTPEAQATVILELSSAAQNLLA